MITLELAQVGIAFAENKAADGERIAVVVYVDQQSGIQVAIPHNEASAREVANHLLGKPHIAVANGIPPHVNGQVPPIPGRGPQG